MSGADVVLVTGASGAIGVEVCNLLRASGSHVRAFVHSRPAPSAHEEVRGDLASGEGVAEAVSGVDSVVHLAATTHARRRADYSRLNEGGTEALVAAAKRSGVDRVVHASTHVASSNGGFYAQSKLAAEEIVLRAGLRAVVVRLPEVYGGAGTEGVDRILRLVRRDAPVPLPGNGHHEVRPVLAAEAAKALVAAINAERAASKTYTLAGEAHTLRSFTEICIDEFDSSSRIIGIPERLLALTCRAASVLPLPLYPDQLDRLRVARHAPSKEAAADLGFAPLPLRQGLKLLRRGAAGDRR